MYVRVCNVYVLIPVDSFHEICVLAYQMDNIWHPWRSVQGRITSGTHLICLNTYFMEWIHRYKYIHVTNTYIHGIYVYIYILCMYMVYTLFIDICTCLHLYIELFCVQDTSLLSLLIPSALKRFPKMSLWNNVGVLVPSFSLPDSPVHRGGDLQRIHPTDAVQMTSLNTGSSAQLPTCMWLLLPTWWAEFHWSPCSWLVTQPLPFLTSTASTRVLASRVGLVQ